MRFTVLRWLEHEVEKMLLDFEEFRLLRREIFGWKTGISLGWVVVDWVRREDDDGAAAAAADDEHT